jgi:hypothetical protein
MLSTPALTLLKEVVIPAKAFLVLSKAFIRISSGGIAAIIRLANYLEVSEPLEKLCDRNLLDFFDGLV